MRNSVELVALRAELDSARRHVLEIVDGLDEDQLNRTHLPSGWSPIELVRHLTLGDERYWFASIVGGESLDWVPVGVRADWRVEPGTTASEVIADYRRQIETSNVVLNSVLPDDPPRRRDPLWDDWGIDFPTVRASVLHMIVETATHAGHLDAAVELIDGRQHLVID
jgi:hypothetical protein